MEWNVDFINEVYDSLSPYIDNGAVRKCYKPRDAFSASFEDFAQNLAIDDATDEDQCRNAQQELGFDRDYLFDTEVRDEFIDYTCIMHFTGVDTMTEDLADPPVFTEVNFEAPA